MQSEQRDVREVSDDAPQAGLEMQVWAGIEFEEQPQGIAGAERVGKLVAAVKEC
jgi:hypothetical protein